MTGGLKFSLNHIALWIQTSDKGGVLLCRFMSVDFRSLSCPLLLPLAHNICINLTVPMKVNCKA